MSDLIERLRYSRDCCGSLCEEAADRITELEALLDALRDKEEQSILIQQMRRISELKNVIEQNHLKHDSTDRANAKMRKCLEAIESIMNEAGKC